MAKRRASGADGDAGWAAFAAAGIVAIGEGLHIVKQKHTINAQNARIAELLDIGNSWRADSLQRQKENEDGLQ